MGEVWTTAAGDADGRGEDNTATATGVPLNPVTGVGFPDRNPPVTAVDRAEVDVVSPGVSLDKAVTPEVVVVDPATGTPQPVTYTFAATNTGTTPLNRPGATAPGPATEPGWVTDAALHLAAVFTGGDGNGNLLLDPGETWTFTCPGLVAVPTENTATITGQPSDAGARPFPVSAPSPTMPRPSSTSSPRHRDRQDLAPTSRRRPGALARLSKARTCRAGPPSTPTTSPTPGRWRSTSRPTHRSTTGAHRSASSAGTRTTTGSSTSTRRGTTRVPRCSAGPRARHLRRGASQPS